MNETTLQRRTRQRAALRTLIGQREAVRIRDPYFQHPRAGRLATVRTVGAKAVLLDVRRELWTVPYELIEVLPTAGMDAASLQLFSHKVG